MNLARFLLAGLLFTIPACTGKVGGPNGEALSADQACRRVIAAAEQRATRCGDGPWSDDVRAAQMGACLEFAALPGLSLEAARVEACEEAMSSAMCLDDLPAACGQGGPDGFLRATVAPGGTCRSTAECAAPGYCTGTLGDGSCGYCETYIELGEACDDDHLCPTGYTCDGGACTALGTPPGEACTSYGGLNDCVDGFYCKADDPSMGIDGHCSPRPKTGEACDGFEVPCLSTDACVNGACATVVHVGEGHACDEARICDEPTYCVDGTCSAPREDAGVGDPCEWDHDRCVAGLVCDGTCKEPSTTVGAACPCALGLSCVDGACLRQEVGMPCHGLAGAPCGPDLFCKGWTGSNTGTCEPRVKPGGDCAFATDMEQFDVCFGPYFCGFDGVCEVMDPACR